MSWPVRSAPACAAASAPDTTTSALTAALTQPGLPSWHSSARRVRSCGGKEGRGLPGQRARWPGAGQAGTPNLQLPALPEPAHSRCPAPRAWRRRSAPACSAPRAPAPWRRTRPAAGHRHQTVPAPGPGSGGTGNRDTRGGRGHRGSRAREGRRTAAAVAAACMPPGGPRAGIGSGAHLCQQLRRRARHVHQQALGCSSGGG